MAIRWDKLTLKSQEALQKAGELATENGNPELLPIHLLGALLEDKEGIVAPVLRRIYDQMPEPKWVISMGACATSGGVFDNYAIVQGVDKIVPVDVYIPGCPPRPEMLIHAVIMLQDKVMKESIRDRRDAPDEEARAAITPGTLPVTDGSTLDQQDSTISKPYTIASRHEKRRSF